QGVRRSAPEAGVRGRRRHGRTGVPGGRRDRSERPARRRHRTPDPRGDRPVRGRARRGGGVTEQTDGGVAETMPGPPDGPAEPADPRGVTGAPVRRNDPPRAGTLRDASRPGRRGWSFPSLDVPEANLPSEALRSDPPALPEIAERDLVVHFTRLS